MFGWMFPAILIGSGLVIATIFTSLAAFRFGAPLLLIFLGVGLLVGEDGLGLRFQDARSAYFVGSLALAVILFDSGFGTKLRSFRQAAAPAITLATFGVLLTTGFVGIGARYLFDLPWPEAFLLGAIISSTDAAAVFFLLRSGGIRIKEQIRSTLEIESGSNDPMAIFLTIALVELVSSGQFGGAVSELALGFIRQMGLGLAIGFLGGHLIVFTVNRLQLEGGLNPIVILSAALFFFAFAGLLGGSGFLAAYVAGLVAGNQTMRGSLALRRFQDGNTWLAQIVMFLLLGLLATPSQFGAIVLPSIALALFLTFFGRPLAVWLCLVPFRYDRQETTFVAWVGLRGAVSILLAIIPLIGGVANAQLYFNVAFIIVLTSLIVQGWTIAPVARWLDIRLPPRFGPVERIELELPGTAHHELIVYRVVAGSPVVKGERLPRWARPSLVIRDGQSMRFQYAGRLQPGDYVYMFIAPRNSRLLDRLFASPDELSGDDREFFGAFALDPQRSLSDLKSAYEVKLPRGTDMETSLRNFMMARLGGTAELGDRVACGPVDLIVREMNPDGEIIGVGLALEKDPEPEIGAGHLGQSIVTLLEKLRLRRREP
jgi:cell volume regulation protein A